MSTTKPTAEQIDYSKRLYKRLEDAGLLEEVIDTVRKMKHKQWYDEIEFLPDTCDVDMNISVGGEELPGAVFGEMLTLGLIEQSRIVYTLTKKGREAI